MPSTSALIMFALIAGLAPGNDADRAPTVIFVDADATGAGDGSTWCDAYTLLQDALAAARPSGGDVAEIHVAEGV